MAKRQKSREQQRLETRLAIAVVYFLQTIIVVKCIWGYPTLMVDINKFVITLGLFNTIISIYAMDLKNIKGWWNKRLFQAKRRANMRRDVKNEIARREGLGHE